MCVTENKREILNFSVSTHQQNGDDDDNENDGEPIGNDPTFHRFDVLFGQ